MDKERTYTVKFEKALTVMIYTQEALIDVLEGKGVIDRTQVGEKIIELIV